MVDTKMLHNELVVVRNPRVIDPLANYVELPTHVRAVFFLPAIKTDPCALSNLFGEIVFAHMFTIGQLFYAKASSALVPLQTHNQIEKVHDLVNGLDL
jgi:hypothetical protein